MGYEVQIWFEDVARRLPDHRRLDVLDDGERAQASRFRFERDRARFVARRAFRRRVLAHVLGIEPDRVRIRTAANGRPTVDSADAIRFSTSQADGLAVVAVTRDYDLGVDLERVRPIPEAQELADRLYTRPESDHLRAVDAPDRSEAFLALWTRKESVVKAAGEGLSMPLDGFDVLAPATLATGRAGESRFTLASLDGIPGYVGAVAVAGGDEVSVRMMDAGVAW